MELTIFINSAGINTNYDNIFDTLKSIRDNVGISDYSIYYVCETQTILNQVYQIFKQLNIIDKIYKLKLSNDSWAINYNLFFEEVKNKSRYILISHDDLTINTNNFFNMSIDILKNSNEKIGWITFTNNGYYNQINKPISNSVREGFLKDRFNSPRTFECHNFHLGEEYSSEKLSLPLGPVKCHGPYSHLNLIKTEALRELCECPDWGPYTLLIDENWCLDSLIKGYNNIWIPHITYTHPLRMQDRKFSGLKNENPVFNKFEETWGWNFFSGDYSDEFIEFICDKYKYTNIAITKDKLSYEWEYLNLN